MLESTALKRFGLELPRVPLVERVTPVERFHFGGQEITVKRDDLTSSIYGGNKVRKLEYLLGQAQHFGKRTVMTTGAYGSHHVLATAVHGGRAGFEVHGVMVPQPLNAHVIENARAGLAAGAVMHFARNPVLVPAVVTATRAQLRFKRRPAYFFGHGGSTPIGTLGYVSAGLELGDQINAGECDEPSALFVALGSGATVAGLAVGLAAAGLTTRVVGVRATPRVAANTAIVKRLVRGVLEVLQNGSRVFPRVERDALNLIEIDGSQYGNGYGHRTRASDVALAEAAEQGLQLDPTYTSKAFAAVLARRAPAMFLQTLSSADMKPLLRMAPSIPRWMR